MKKKTSNLELKMKQKQKKKNLFQNVTIDTMNYFLMLIIIEKCICHESISTLYTKCNENVFNASLYIFTLLY